MRLAWLVFASTLARPAFADDTPTPPTPPSTDPAVTAPRPPADAPPGQTAATPPDDEGDVGTFRPLSKKDIVITVPGDRSTKNIAMLAGIAAGGVLLSGIGLYFNLDSKSAA